MSMQPDSYDSLREALEKIGLNGQMQNREQLVISTQAGPAWPNRGNSFWLTYKKETWYLFTWLPVGYRIPTDQDVVALCSACMIGGLAMYRVPSEIITRFKLQELTESECEGLLPRE